MPHYMLQFSYSAAAVKAMVDKPQDREAVAKAAMEAAGGKLLHFYFTFGHHDAVVISELPDNAAAASVAMLLGATGVAASAHTTVLLTSHEAQAAMQHAHEGKSKYKPPHG